jgi:hypothetical protein
MDNGEYGESLKRFHGKTIPQTRHAVDATVILNAAPLPVLIQGKDVMCGGAQEPVKIGEPIKDTATGNAASAVAEFPERSQSAVVKDESLVEWAKEEEQEPEHSAKDDDLIPDPDNEVQDGPFANITSAAKSGFEAGKKLGGAADDWSDEAREKAAEARRSGGVTPEERQTIKEIYHPSHKTPVKGTPKFRTTPTAVSSGGSQQENREAANRQGYTIKH